MMYLKEVKELTKFKLSVYNACVVSTAYLCGTPAISAATLSLLTSGSFLMAASSQSFGQLIEIEEDSAMKRTKNRPMPMERISKNEAALITATTGFASISLLT